MNHRMKRNKKTAGLHPQNEKSVEHDKYFQIK